MSYTVEIKDADGRIQFRSWNLTGYKYRTYGDCIVIQSLPPQKTPDPLPAARAIVRDWLTYEMQMSDALRDALLLISQEPNE